MATFDDSEDIKISTSLDTEGAIKAAQDLKNSIENAIKATAGQFDQLQKASKQLAAVLKDQATKEVTDTKQKLDQELKATIDTGNKEIAVAQKVADERVRATTEAINKTVAAQDRAFREEKLRVKEQSDFLKNQNIQALLEIEKIRKQTATIKRTPRAELPPELGGVSSSGKIFKELEKVAISIGNRFTFLTASLGTLNNLFNALPGPIGSVGKILTVVTVGITQFNKKIDETSQAAGKLEGLRTGFETLQRGLGESPTKSLDALRKSTQGLISDTELYQKANQAVLLNVPTKVFNEAAGAAVKLGRAMGIDAAFALESLSLGLGRQSRLYLDNLGIVVSAEEAYQKFAVANNIVGRSLTDSEKRAAFYAESLQKIRERANELPDILDSVGVAASKVGVAQENVNAAYLNGFNQSTRLAESYQNQAKIISSTVQTNELFGRQIGYIGSISKDIGNVFLSLGASIKTGLVEGLDLFLRQDPARQIDSLEAANRRLADSVKRDAEELVALKQNQDGNADSIDKVNRRVEANTAEYLKNQQIIEELKRTIIDTRDEAGNPIKIKVDLTEIFQSQQTFQTFISGLRNEILSEGGAFEIPGISKDALANAGAGIENLTLKVIESKGKFQEFDQEFEKIKNTIAFDVISQKATEYGRSISALNDILKNTADKSSDFYKETAKQVQVLTREMRESTKQAGLNKQQEEGLKKVIQAKIAAAKKAASENTKNLKDSARDLKKEERALEEFTRGINRALEQSIPDDFQKQLIDIFNAPKQSADELARRIYDLGIKFKATGGDVQAFIKEAAKLKDLKDAIPDRPLVGSAEQTKSIDDYNEKLKSIQSSMLNFREILTGAKEGGGGFFGFDLGTAFDAKSEAQLAGSIQNGLSTAFSAAVDGFTRDDVPELAGAIGGAIGTAVGAYFGGEAGGRAGAIIGTELGNMVGEALKVFGDDTKGTKERKKIDQYFADLFSGERLAVVIQGQITGAIDEATGQAIRNAEPQIARISDLTFEGMTAMAGRVGFGGDGFNAYFETLSSSAQAAFNGIGIAFGSLNGIATEQARLIGIALANNIGGSLQNLQVLIQATGESFDDLAKAVLNSFLDAQLSIEEAYNALVQLQNLYQVGLPDALGAYEQAARNLFNILKDDRPGRYAVDSLRDIGAEGIEAKKTFETVIASLGQTFTFTAEQQTRLFEALRINGITSLAQLQAASDEQLLAILRNIQLIRDNASAPLVTTPTTTLEKPKTPSSGGPKKKSPQEEAADLLKKQTEEAAKLLKDSQDYLGILDKISNRQISIADAGAEIVKKQKELLDLIIQRDKYETAFNKELSKGSKANKEQLADLGTLLRQIDEQLKNTSESAKKATREYKQLSISGIIPLITEQNTLGVVAGMVGVNLEKNIDILIKGFVQGRLTIAEVNDEIRKTKDLLGPGIPGAVGAVTEAFQNLLDAGQKGGKFSLDAFTDIFAEFREKFTKETSDFRKTQGEQLRQNLDAAEQAYNTAVGPQALDAAKKSLDLAKKALSDFYANVPVPDLTNLRIQLETAFGQDQIDKFFQALGESGLSTFDEFEKAGTDTIVSILGRLTELGFRFNETTGDISGINQGLQDAEKSANAGLDPLKEAIDLVKRFNDGASVLPPIFDATSIAVENLNGPLTTLANGFQSVIEQLGQLQGNKFENDVVFNVSTVGESGAKALVDIIFGDGSGISASTGGAGGVGGNQGGIDQLAAERAKLREEIRKLESKRNRTSAETKKLKQKRQRLRELSGG